MNFTPRGVPELQWEAKDVLLLTDATEVSEYIMEQQQLDKEYLQAERVQRAGEREGQKAEQEHELAMEQLRNKEAPGFVNMSYQ